MSIQILWTKDSMKLLKIATLVFFGIFLELQCFVFANFPCQNLFCFCVTLLAHSLHHTVETLKTVVQTVPKESFQMYFKINKFNKVALNCNFGVFYIFFELTFFGFATFLYQNVLLFYDSSNSHIS